MGNESGMKIILDTHVLIWSQEAPKKIGPEASKLLLHEDNDLLLCSISTLEISRLIASKKIAIKGSLERWIEKVKKSLDLESISLDDKIAENAYLLPEPFHNDPADRILVAAAQVCGAVIMTADEKILSYRFIQSVDVRK